jgi:anaphase-promoting complex subunit 10
MRIQEISVYIDFKTDESYTPSKISIRVANSFHELQEIREVEFEEPVGWFTFKLQEKNTEGEVLKPYIKTMFV